MLVAPAALGLARPAATFFGQAQQSMQAALATSGVTVGEFRGDYWQQSRRPLVSLAFVTPLLIIYEVGVLWLGPAAMRNGADVWLRQFLDLLGFSQYFLLPVLTVGLLLAWHHLTGEPWIIRPNTLYGMAAECVLLAIALVVIARIQGSLLAMVSQQPPPAVLHAFMGEISGVFKRFVGFMGAGIYEELLFRLMLLPCAAWILRACSIGQGWSLFGAAVITSVLFAGAHHMGSGGEALAWYPMIFRTVAGLFFSALFIYRGFGIAAGTHATYDVFVGLL